jgi:hypothetical protein
MALYRVTTGPDQFPDTEESSTLSLFDKHNPDKNLFNLIDDEVIKLSGSEILLYKYHKSDDGDEVYMENKRKAINSDPVILFGHYDPRVIEENLTQFGVEVQNDQVFTFNKSYVERLVGRTIIIGDILKPSFQDMKFEVYEVQEDSFESYGIYHLMVHCKLLRDSSVIHNDNMLDTTDLVGGKI